MTNPKVLKSVLADGTKSNYQDCVAEVSSAYMIPKSLVKRAANHSPNGVILATEEGPAVAETQDLGIIEIEELRPESCTKYDQTTQIPDNSHLLVHWLKSGDKVFVAMTDPQATRNQGIEMVVGANGTIKKPTAEAAWDLHGRHKFSLKRATATGDTVAKVEYQGLGSLDDA